MRLGAVAGTPVVEAGLPLPTSRRAAVRRIALAAATAGLAELPGLAQAAPDRQDRERWPRTFAVFCDTLVPADALTPAASTLGVPEAILRHLRGNPLGERLLGAGCAWLDSAVGGDFAAADEPVRVAACGRMQAMPWDSPPGRFFQVMRNTVLADYYADPRSWRGLALDRPPQPLGFFEAVR